LGNCRKTVRSSAILSGKTDCMSSRPVKLLVKPKRRSLLQTLGFKTVSWLLLAGLAMFLTLAIGSGIRLILDPYSPNWLLDTFPFLGKADPKTLVTVSSIQTELAAEGLSLGQPLIWEDSTNSRSTQGDWLMPVMKPQSACTPTVTALASEEDCQTIVSLRVYRPQGRLGRGKTVQERTQNRLFRLMNEVSIQAPKTAFVTTPLIGTASETASVEQGAPLKYLRRFTVANQTPWLLLEGSLQRGSERLRYGQFLFYSPQSTDLTLLMNWTSPPGELPTFVELNQKAPLELMVNQTVGLEPRFQAFMVSSGQPPALQEISLARSVFKEPPSTSLYNKALKLAQGGIWGHALQMMQSAKKTMGSAWSNEAEVQLNLIAAHARITQNQAKQTWSSQRQQIVAYLIDGQWESALKQLEKSPTVYPDLIKWLKVDFDRLWQKVNTYLQIHPKDTSAQVWAALMIQAHQSPQASEDWLKKYPATKAARDRWQALIQAVQKANPAELSADAGGNSLGVLPQYRQWLGQVSPPSSVTAASLDSSDEEGADLSAEPVAEPEASGPPVGNWISPRLEAKQENWDLASDEGWYEIRVLAVYGGQNWLPSTLARYPQRPIPAQQVWRWLGLDQALIPLYSLQSGTVQVEGSLKVRGVQYDGAQITILATGPKELSPSDAEVLSLFAGPGNGVGRTDFRMGTPLSQFFQRSSAWNRVLAETVPGVLGLSTPSGSGAAAFYPYLRVSAQDVTGDASADLILSLDPSSLPEPLRQQVAFMATTPRTVILSTAGNILYNDIQTLETVVGLLNSASPTASAGLWIEQQGQYRLQIVATP
jgi:hypothetical protein